MATPYSTSSVRPGRSAVDPRQPDSLIDVVHRCVCSLFTIVARDEHKHPIFGRHWHAVSIRPPSISSNTAAINHRE